MKSFAENHRAFFEWSNAVPSHSKDAHLSPKTWIRKGIDFLDKRFDSTSTAICQWGYGFVNKFVT
jgi:hypothetical protein